MQDIGCRDSRRRQYRGIEFKIGKPTRGYFNLWQGFGVEESEHGSCDLFWAYLRDMVCSGDMKLYHWLVGWIAHLVQKPEEKPGVAVVLRGLKGTGKTMLGEILRDLVPNNSAILSSPQDLLGAFNAHLQNALVVQVDEAFWAGDKRAEGQLKNLITAPKIGIMPKFINRYEVENYARFLITSNEAWIVPATLDERRFTVIDVSDVRRRDRVYFGALTDQLDNGGYKRLLWELRHVDLSACNPCEPFTTAALFDQVVEFFNPAERFVWELLRTGGVPGGSSFEAGPWDEDGAGTKFPCDDLYEAMRNFEQGHGRKYPTHETAFGKLLKRMVPCVERKRIQEDGKRGYDYVFPSLSECRANFGKRNGFEIDWTGNGLGT